MAIWSEYMREKDRLEKGKCPKCHGIGMKAATDITEGIIMFGEESCPACGGSGYDGDIDHSGRPVSWKEQCRVMKVEADSANAEAARLHAALVMLKGTLRDYSTSELMAEYMRRDGGG